MKTALLVGGGLIGFSFAQRFVDAGWQVRMTDVRAELADAATGPFESNRLGGGPEGIKSIIEHIAGAWDTELVAGVPDMSHLGEVYAQVDAAYGNDAETFESATRRRNALLRGFLDVRAAH
ncbi:hypothetical protein GWO58_05405 [Corynebacterium macginleyi]|uniref:hypothetical protein n=1 Tax=Corynebacterium macginleyi TaxID=38290 RepID=UPI00190BB5D4|nr:hypothetical protein [Corynebacterium macginleyi]MBK4146254.1 hypothetical protein [Corynebacterium macginleyi]